MSVNAETPIASSIANGVTTVFPYSFTVLAAADLKVQGLLSGVTTLYVLGVDYTVLGVGTNSGSATFFVAPANTTVITRYRDTQITRATDYQDNGDLLSATLDLDFDRLYLLMQEIFSGGEGVVNALRVPNGETVPALSSAASRANLLLGFDSGGNPITVAPVSGSAAALALDLASTSDAAKGDALVGVKTNLVGSVARTQHAKNLERLSAEDFGAGTGVADNTTAIQDALNAAAAAGGGVVHIGPGRFTKAGVLTMPQYVTLKGSGVRATYIDNTTANVNGVNMGAGLRHGGLEDLSLTHKTGDTTNIGVSFNAVSGYAHGRFLNVLITGFNHSVSAGDELWECEFNNVRCDNPLSRGFLVLGSSGTASDNLLTKCYVNNVGAGAATGKSFEFTSAMSKSVMLNCTFGDTSSTESQIEIGTNVKALEIVGGNAEGFTLSNNAAVINVGSASVVSVRGLAFQSVNGPGAGSAALLQVYDSATLNVSGCSELSAPTGTLYSLRATGASTARLFHSGNAFLSLTDTVISSGPQITQLLGKQTVHTLTAIDLSGAAATRFLIYLPNLYGHLVSARLIYTEATSADAGVLVSVGYVGSTSFLASVTSAVSRALWDTTSMTINDRRIGGWPGPIIVTCGGAKTGIGEVLVMLEFTTI